MQIGLIGLGKMGFNLALNLKRNGYEVVAYDVNQTTLQAIQAQGIKTATSLENLVNKLNTKRIIWMMIPAGDLVDKTIQELKPLLSVSDILIDGGNSFYKDSVRRAKELEALQVSYKALVAKIREHGLD